MRQIIAMLLAYKWAKRVLLVEIKNGMPERAQFIENVFDATYKHTYQLLTREF